MAVVFIDVTAEDIRQGQSDPDKRVNCCPVYLAARRVVQDLCHVSPCDLVIWCEENYAGTMRIELPKVARQFINMADTQANVAAGRLKKDPNDVDQEALKPIRFPIHIPDRKRR